MGGGWVVVVGGEWWVEDKAECWLRAVSGREWWFEDGGG
jgi:hypothetical protein